jgi:hypothetical protein
VGWAGLGWLAMTLCRMNLSGQTVSSGFRVAHAGWWRAVLCVDVGLVIRITKGRGRQLFAPCQVEKKHVAPPFSTILQYSIFRK